MLRKKEGSHSEQSSRKVFRLFVCFFNINVFYVEKLYYLKIHSLESLVVLVLLSTHKHTNIYDVYMHVNKQMKGKAVGVTMYIPPRLHKGKG